MKSDVSQRFLDFCKRSGIYVYRNRKSKIPYEKLIGTAEVILKTKENKIRCEITFGKDIKEEIVIGLFDSLQHIGALIELELNNVPFIPTQIGNLVFLKCLEIYSKYVIKLPIEMRNLTNLIELSLRMECLTKIPEWIFDFDKLEILDLFGTHIKELPDNICNLQNLKILDLCCTHLDKVPRSILDLNLQFKDHFNESDSPGIYFCDSTCKKPSTDIIYGGRKRLEFYYRSNKKVPQNEVRVILLGKKGSGKTSMVQRLMEKADGKSHFTENNKWTQGISIKDINSKKGGVLHVWDFGGQEMMLSTHTLFLRDHCIYVIVLNARQGDEPECWLDYINQFGKNSSVFIVNNHIDMADVSQLDMNKLKRLYPKLSIDSNRILATSCIKTDEFPLDELYEKLLETAEEYFKHEVAFSWRSINSNLRDMKTNGKSVNYITHEEYLGICEECGITELDEKIEALNWLNEIGTVFTYGNPHAIKKINEYKILRPVWVTDAVYKIINYYGDHGKDSCLITHDQIRLALLAGKSENGTENEYSDSEVGFILEVMRKFYLSFECNETSEFIPAIAKNEEPREVAEWTKNQDEIMLDILYNLSQNDQERVYKSSVNLTFFYQIIIKIVENFGKYPKMWRLGALFENICSMQVLIFLQNRGNWDYEMRLMIKREKREEDGARALAANLNQRIFSYLREFADNYIIDTKVLVRSDKEFDYISVDEAAKTILNNRDSSYNAKFDGEIDLFKDVLVKVAPDFNGRLKAYLMELREEIKKGNQQTANAVNRLYKIWESTSDIQIKLEEYNHMLQVIKNNESRWMEMYSKAICSSDELRRQLQTILDSSILQEHDTVIIKELVEELSNKNSGKKGIVDKVKEALSVLSAGVTLITADYNNVENIKKVYDILKRIQENIIKQI